MTFEKKLGKSTQAIHAGERVTSATEKSGIPLLPPIYQNSTFRFTTAAECAEAFRDEESGYVYTRWGNPTQEVLETKLAVLEAGEAALATASGMGAVSTALLTALADGGHVVAMENLYSATFQILNEELPRFGIETTFVDATDPSQIERAIRADTKVLYLESPTNPLLKLIDLRASAEIAKAHGVTSIIDNTFATPCGQQPITLGIDVVVHSMTKYLSGTGAVVAGAIVGRKAFVTRAKTGALRNFGAVISPFNAWVNITRDYDATAAICTALRKCGASGDVSRSTSGGGVGPLSGFAEPSTICTCRTPNGCFRGHDYAGAERWTPCG